jgi:two-component system NarL family response regulator
MREALTRREEEILALITSGLTNKAIALKLTVAVGTVKSHVRSHVRSIFRKLDAENRTQAVAIARRRGIVRDERKYSRIGADRNIGFADDRPQ